MWGIPKEEDDEDYKARIVWECSRDLVDLRDTDNYMWRTENINASNR